MCNNQGQCHFLFIQKYAMFKVQEDGFICFMSKSKMDFCDFTWRFHVVNEWVAIKNFNGFIICNLRRDVHHWNTFF